MIEKFYWAILQANKGVKLMKLASAFPPLFHALEGALNFRITTQENEFLNQLMALRADIRTRNTKIPLYCSTKCFNVTTRELVDRHSVPAGLGRFLFKFVRELKPRLCLEVGTCIGISAAYQAKALKLNGRGMMFSLEDQEALVSFARYLLENFGLDNVQVIPGLASITLEKVLQEYGPIDYAFIDADHKEDKTLSFFSKIVSHISDGGVIIFDDIWHNLGMIKAWRSIKRDSRVKVSASFLRIGICLIDQRIPTKEHFTL